MPARPAEDLWPELVDEAGGDEIERAASVSVAQAERDVAAAGFDVAAERAKAVGILAALEQGAPASTQAAAPATETAAAVGPAPVVTVARRASSVARRPRAVASRVAPWVALIAAVGLGITARTGGVVSIPRPEELAKTHATELRRDAFAACDALRYRECEEKLDRARALDPNGEQEAKVQARRRLLESAPRGP